VSCTSEFKRTLQRRGNRPLIEKIKELLGEKLAAIHADSSENLNGPRLDIQEVDILELGERRV